MRLRIPVSLVFCLVVAGCATGPEPVSTIADANPAAKVSAEEQARRERRLRTMAAPIPQRSGLVRGKP